MGGYKLVCFKTVAGHRRKSGRQCVAGVCSETMQKKSVTLKTGCSPNPKRKFISRSATPNNTFPRLSFVIRRVHETAKKQLLAFVMSVCPYVRPVRLHGTPQLSLDKFDILSISRKPVEKIQVSLKYNNLNGCFA